jgi:hypothetical protein
VRFEAVLQVASAPGVTPVALPLAAVPKLHLLNDFKLARKKKDESMMSFVCIIAASMDFEMKLRDESPKPKWRPRNRTNAKRKCLKLDFKAHLNDPEARNSI